MIVDDDESFAPHVVGELAEFLNGDGAGGIVWVPYHTKEQGNDGVPVVHALSGERLDVMAQRAPVRTKWCPGGFLMISRAALATFAEVGGALDYVDAAGRELHDFATSDFVTMPRNEGGKPVTVKRGPDLRFAHMAHAAGIPIWMFPHFDVLHAGGGGWLALPKAPAPPAPPLSDRSVCNVKRGTAADGSEGWAKDDRTEAQRERDRIDAIYTPEFYAGFADQADEYEDVARSLLCLDLRTARPMAIDVGCGPGQLVAALRSLGVAAWGLDASSHAREAAAEVVRPFICAGAAGDALARLDRPAYDLVTCFEVAEHIAPERAGALVASLAYLARDARERGTIVFTAAAPGQGGLDHVNEQPMAYWRALFRANGFEPDPYATAKLVYAWRSFKRMWWMPKTVEVFR